MVLMVVLLLATLITTMAVVEVGAALNEGFRARTAADAAALAGAAEGESAAADIAEANGGMLVSYSEQEVGSGGTSATATVRVGRISRTARASAQVEWAVSSEGG